MRTSHGPATLTPLAPPPVLAVLAVLAAFALSPPAGFAQTAAGRTGLEVPSLARRLAISGTVVIEALLDTTGNVRATNVLRSQPLLDDAAAESVRRMRFDAAVVEGRAVASTRTVTVEFPPVAGNDPAASAEETRRCSETLFVLELPPRPDSTGRFEAHWQATGLKSQELLLVLIFPDAVEVDTAGSGVPLRFVDESAVPGWPTWRRDGRLLRQKPDGASGKVSFVVPDRTWWEKGRIAWVALFHDVFEDRIVARQFVFEIARDEEGPVLVRDPRVRACSATVAHTLRPRG